MVFNKIILLFTLYSACNLFSQVEPNSNFLAERREEIGQILEKTEEHRRLKVIDSLILSSSLNSPIIKPYLLIEKASCLQKLIMENYGSDTLGHLKIINEVLFCYDTAFDLVICTDKNLVLYKRYLFLKHLVYVYRTKLSLTLTQRYLYDLSELKKLGLIPEKDGFGIGVFLFQGKDTWFGLDFSFFSSKTGSARLRRTCETKETKVNFIHEFDIYNALTISYARAPNTKTNDLSFSIIEFYSPIIIIPVKFGIQFCETNKSSNFYYLPTIGIGYQYLSLNYSYKFIFSKSARATNETSMFSIRITSPITGQRYKTRKF